MNGNKIVKNVCSVAGLIVFAKLLGFLKQMTSAALFGASLETDLISLSQDSMLDIQYLLAQVLLTAFTSVYIYLQDDSEEKKNRFVSDTLKLFTLISASIVVILMIAAPLIARIIAPTYSPEVSWKLTRYLRLLYPLLILLTYSAIFQAMLNANRRFIPGEMVSVNQSIIFILVVPLICGRFHEKSMIIVFFVYTCWNLIFLFIQSKKYWHFYKEISSGPMLKELLRMSGPLLLGYSMIYINQQVDKILASGLGAGAVTSLGYGAVLHNLVCTFIGSFGSILLTYVTAAIAKGHHKEAASLAMNATKLQLLVFLPISIVTVVCAEDIVSIVFGRGAFGSDAIRETARCLQGYALAFVPLVLKDVFSRYLYGCQDTRSPMINSSIGILVNIALSILMSRYWGVFGITAASSVSVLICGALNYWLAYKVNRELHIKLMLNSVPGMILGGAGCLLVAIKGQQLWHLQSPLVRFILTAVCAILCYAVIIGPIIFKMVREYLSHTHGRDE